MKEDNQAAISFFIPGLNGGGAQKVVVNLANALVELTHRPVYIVLARGEGEFLSEVRPEVNVVVLGKDRASRSIPALARYLRKVRPAVLCSSLNYANICATIAWHLAGRPCRLVLREDSVVRSPQGNVKTKVGMHILQLLMKSFYRGADAVVALSDAVAQTMKDRQICPDNLIKVIANPVVVPSLGDQGDSSHTHQQSFGDRYICAIGRLAEPKGFDVLLDAFEKVSDRDLNLVILGEGPLRDELEHQAQHLGIARRVHLPGFVHKPQAVLSNARLFVMSSRWEGFPNVLMEALALGVPIVSTDCPGAPREILRDGSLGHLVLPENSAELAHAIDAALHAPRGTKEARRSRAEDFAAPVIAAKYLTEAFSLAVDGTNTASQRRQTGAL